MIPSSRSPAPPRSGLRIAGRAQQDHINDPYQAQQKAKEPTVCRECGAIYHRGRWQWAPRPEGADEVLCPACRRIAEGCPAGIVTVHGPIEPRQRDEMIALARHQEAAEKPEHPLNRIIALGETADGLVVNTTDIHLPRRIGEALRRAFHGELDMHFDEGGYFLRVDWRPTR